MMDASKSSVTYFLRDGAVICLQSFGGLLPSGIFYGWGAIIESINVVFNPNNPLIFKHNHGIFSGVIILFLSVVLMGPYRILMDSHFVSEFHMQLLGLVMTSFGFFMGGISVQYKQLWLLYLGCAIPCGIGGLLIYQRLVFNHQLWFRSIGMHNLGSGLFGFFIGIWTVVFFLVFTPLLESVGLHNVLYIYASLSIPTVLIPVLTIGGEMDSSNILEKSSSDDNVSVDDGVEFNVRTNTHSVEGSNSRTMTNETGAHNNPNYIRINVDAVSEEKEISQIQSCDISAVAIVPTIDPLESPNQQNHESLAQQCHELGIDIDDDGHCALTYSEIIVIPQTWILVAFYITVLTPGWGIKLASFEMLKGLFEVTQTQAAAITAIYVTAYAFGRLCMGVLAEFIGATRSYDIIIVTTVSLLFALPATCTTLPHISVSSPGCTTFVLLICVIGLMYGGAVALLYSMPFDVFGKRNYRSVFSVTLLGFGCSVIVGGLSSAYSFTGPAVTPERTLALASSWFYAMAASCITGLVLLHLLIPFDYVRFLECKVAAAHSRVLEGNSRPHLECAPAASIPVT